MVLAKRREYCTHDRLLSCGDVLVCTTDPVDQLVNFLIREAERSERERERGTERDLVEYAYII